MKAILQETGVRRAVQVAVNAPTPDILKCQRLETSRALREVDGTHSVVRKRWTHLQPKLTNSTSKSSYATLSLQGNALTWWNSHVKTTTHEAAHAMPWRTLKKMMTDKYCPRGEIKKLEFEMLEFEGKGNEVVAYTNVFPRTGTNVAIEFF
ncbi:putative reverse transcriptase domain-containing protein [Tanacetum coccineum]